MARFFTYSALALRVRSSGESNREAWFLTAEEGILRVTVFGGPKSKLRAQVAPYHQGKLWVYRDPVRESLKATDFDVQSWRPGIREGYIRSAAAAAIAETILTAHGGGGGWEQAMGAASASLDALEKADEPCCARIIIHFLWNWADILGLRPALNSCGSCACELPENGVLWYSDREELLLCPSCGGNFNADRAALLPLGQGARRWLTVVQDMEPSRLTRYTLDEPSVRQAKALVTAILAGALGKRLDTWNF
jgi:DNA repair protein RecO (recombination protein O)